MARLWIVHREPRWRDALVTMAGSLDVLAGDPTDAARFDAAQPPRAVLLGVAGDFEAELEFAYRFAPRLAGTAWVLLARSLDAPEVTRLFDALPATLVPIASDAAVLRRRVRAALAHKPAAALTARHRRDAIAARFARWFGDLELPELLAATDPARAAAPLVVRGEPGTGRGLLARYLHAVTAADATSPFASVACVSGSDPLALLADLAPETGELPSAGPLSVCFEDVDRLAPAAQRVLRAVIENGAPAGRLRAARVRWIATAGDPHDDGGDFLDPELARALAGFALRIPPLRERPLAIEAIANGMTHAFAASRGEPERRLDPAAVDRLRRYPWPGNHRELEAVILRTLTATHADPIAASDLHFERLDLGPLEPDRLDDPRSADLEAVAREPSPTGIPVAAPTRKAESSDVADDGAIRRLSAAVAHEVGNPLVGIRTYAAMLPSRFDDPEFRRQFAERVETDTRRIEAVIETLTQLGSLPEPARVPVDVSSMLARLLERERPRIRERRLVVLEELDRTEPCVLGDAEQLRFAFGLLLEQALGWMPERGDLYVATRHQDARSEGEARMRILVRFRAPAGDGLGFGDNALAVAAVDAVVRAHGGSLALESTASGEATVLIELPAPQQAGEHAVTR
jgi:DNA-binding NtrC family response regulator